MGITSQQAIRIAIETVGCEGIDDWCEASGDRGPMESIAIGTCLGCGETSDVEPDCDDGYCAECGTYSVRSLPIMLGVL